MLTLPLPPLLPDAAAGASVIGAQASESPVQENPTEVQTGGSRTPHPDMSVATGTAFFSSQRSQERHRK